MTPTPDDQFQSKSHWDNVYATKPAHEVSWYQARAERSLQLICSTGVSYTAAIIDVGGGSSVLVDDLLNAGYRSITVLDIAAAALEISRRRIGSRAADVQWLTGDITQMDARAGNFDVWHDRAVFHFLTTEDDRRAYVGAARQMVRPGGHLIVATFAADGPSQCSGLPVNRYSAEELHAEFGSPFVLVGHEYEDHGTPFGSVQRFVYCHMRRESKAP